MIGINYFVQLYSINFYTFVGVSDTTNLPEAVGTPMTASSFPRFPAEAIKPPFKNPLSWHYTKEASIQYLCVPVHMHPEICIVNYYIFTKLGIGTNLNYVIENIFEKKLSFNTKYKWRVKVKLKCN